MIVKETIIKAIKKMPGEFSAEELINCIILLDKVDNGLKDIANGKIYSIDEVQKEYQKNKP